MNNNQIVLHLNNALFSLGYARQKLGDNEFADRAESITAELQALADDIYGAPVIGAVLSPTPEPSPGPSNTPDFDPPYDKPVGITLTLGPTDADYKMTDKVQFIEEYEGIKSIEPAEIVGKIWLWVFNTKNRQLQLYHAADDTGFTVKGTTLQRFNEERSYGKTLRWPDKQLPQILAAENAINWLDAIKAVPKPLTGRINKHCLLLKVM